MTKTRLALVTAILALTTMLASTADAGPKVRLQFGYPLGSFTAHGNSGGKSGGYSRHHRKKRHNYVHRNSKSKVKVTKKRATATKSVAKAKVEPEAEVQVEKVKAETENSSISTAAIAPANVTGSAAASADENSDALEEPKSAKTVDCKKFFPSVGMTLTVPCE
ncbi:MAG TPA: hypothetical protein VGA65_01030 [Hyphomicrobium sp.]